MNPSIAGLSFPEDRLYLVEHDVWARVEANGAVTVGITALGIKLSGEIYMCRPKPVGTLVEQGRAVAVVELAKAIVSVKSAVGGRIVEVNARLADAPELVHEDPYGGGWIARLSPSSLDVDRTRLIDGAEVLDAMARHAEAMGRDDAG